MEEGSDEVLGVLGATTGLTTSRIAYVECRAAFARASREGRLSSDDELLAVSHLDERWLHLQVVELDDALARRAGALTRDHSLRAADAIHLASAELLSDASGSDTVFACWNRRLWTAARALGFEIVPRAIS